MISRKIIKFRGPPKIKLKLKRTVDNVVKKMNVKSEFNIKRGKGLLAREK